jgi:hypothetical protein
MDYNEDDQLIEQQEALDQKESMELADEEQEARQWLLDQSPQSKMPESLFGLFRDTWKSKDSSKVANLDKGELGQLTISVRGCQHLAALGHQFNHPTFGEFFRNQGEIVLKTSASKRGWFTELFVSQKKYNNRSMSSTPLSDQAKAPWSIKNMLPGSGSGAPTPVPQQAQ